MNRKRAISFALTIWAIPVWSQTAPLPGYWRYVHPSAKMIAGIDLSAASTSQMGVRFKKEMEQMGMKRTISGQGMDFLFDADQLLISSPAEGSAAMAAKTSTPVVISMKGTFVLATIRKAAVGQGAIPGIYRGVSVLRTDKDDKAMTLAMVSPQIIVAGDRASVHAAIDNAMAATPSQPIEGLYTKAVELAKQNDFWFLSNTSLAGAGGTTPQEQMLAEVASVAGGVSFKNGLGINFNLGAKSAESATKLAAGLQALMALSALAGPGDSSKGAMDLLQKMQIATSGDQVKIGVNYSVEEMDRGINELKAEMMAPPKRPVTVAGATPATPQFTVVPPPPREDPNRPMIVKIYNMDGGTQQIDLNKK